MIATLFFLLTITLFPEFAVVLLFMTTFILCFVGFGLFRYGTYVVSLFNKHNVYLKIGDNFNKDLEKFKLGVDKNSKMLVDKLMSITFVKENVANDELNEIVTRKIHDLKGKANMSNSCSMPFISYVWINPVETMDNILKSLVITINAKLIKKNIDYRLNFISSGVSNLERDIIIANVRKIEIDENDNYRCYRLYKREFITFYRYDTYNTTDNSINSYVVIDAKTPNISRFCMKPKSDQISYRKWKTSTISGQLTEYIMVAFNNRVFLEKSDKELLKTILLKSPFIHPSATEKMNQ